MARGKGRAVWFVALVLSLTLALAHGASAVTCSGYAKKACRKNDACQWTGSSCVAPTDVCSGIQAKKVGGVSKKRRCNGKAECRCSGNKKCGTCVANVGVGAPSPSPDGGPACSSPWTVNPGLTCGMVKNTCADWKYLSCTQSGKTCTGPDRTGGNALIAGEYCSYVWPLKVDACSSPWKVNPGLTCGMVKNTCAKWKSLSCSQSGATCTGPDRTGGGQLVAGESCSYVW